jgi:putative flippase GtrA
VARPLLLSSRVKNPREVLASGLAGAAGTVIDFAVLVLLVELTTCSIPLSAFLGATSGAAVCFLMNKHIAFRDRSPVTLRQLARFGLVAVASALLMALAMRIVAVDLRVPYLAAKALCAALIFIVWTYPAQRRLVFVRRPAPAV